MEERSCCVQDTLNCSGLLTGNLMIVPKGTLNVRAHATGKTLRLTFVEPSSGMFSPRKERKNKVHALCLKKFPDDAGSGMTLWFNQHVYATFHQSCHDTCPICDWKYLERRSDTCVSCHRPWVWLQSKVGLIAADSS